MAKGSRGGKLSGGNVQTAQSVQTNLLQQLLNNNAQQNAQYNAQRNAQPIQNAQQTPQSMSADFNNFMAMSDDDKADVIADMVKQGVPAHLADNDFQKFIYNIGLNDKPDVVDDATFNAMSGTAMYRTVNGVKNKQIGVTYSAPEIAKQIQGGSITRVSDSGGSAYGRGLYFTPNCSHSMSRYGDTVGDVKETCTIRMKLNSNAKIITKRDAVNGLSHEINRGTKLGKAISKCDYDSQVSLYAIAKGYNVISDGGRSGYDYHNVLNRQAMTMNKSISAKTSSGRWK